VEASYGETVLADLESRQETVKPSIEAKVLVWKEHGALLAVAKGPEM
jgi:hypothetical protein